MPMPDFSFLTDFHWDSDATLWVVIAGVVLAIALFMLLKGVLKMLMLALAVCAAVALWVFLQKNGFTLLELVIPRPSPWMVQALAWGCSGFLLLVFFHGAMWFSQLFSFSRHVGAGGIVTTILMCILMLWLATIGISYYGDVCLVRYYHELAVAKAAGQAELPAKPWFTVATQALRSSTGTSWLQHIDPMENPAQRKLACLVAYGCTVDEASYTAFYKAQLEPLGIPQSTRLLELFGDKGLRTLVAEGRFVTLLENSRLTTFLQFKNTEDIILELRIL